MNGEITYTFSRALYLMRYGGKKMSPVSKNFVDDWVYFVDGDVLFVITGKYPHKNSMVDIVNVAECMDSDDIMGSWVEVQDEKH